MQLLTYYHTLKYLKTSQILYRVVKHFSRPRPRDVRYSIAKAGSDWIDYKLLEQRLFANNKVFLLNKSGIIKNAADWNDPQYEKLWLYNLHYFDDLNAFSAEDRVPLHISFINQWIDQNPAPVGNGWEPYPSSLRIVNWIKAFLARIDASPLMQQSLAKQVDYLSKNLEYHLLGNHLFANAKAMIFAGLFFDGKAASKWLLQGVRIYERELERQILADGGNFELSPMYHAIMTIDLLDLLNLFSCYSEKVNIKLVEKTRSAVTKMLHWLNVMSHSDGEISFFNDSALGITARPAIIYGYAEALDLEPVSPIDRTYIKLSQSGYSRINMPGYSVLFDHAKVGPDYLPGHAHADSLSLEMSVGEQRVLVNSGTSLYGYNAERQRQRETAAHNTVVVDNEDSSQVWSGFRVAKRAYVSLQRFGHKDSLVELEASHNGYMRLKGKVTHSRSISATPEELKVTDSLTGQWSSAEAIYHLHPDIKIKTCGNNRLLLCLPDLSQLLVSSTGQMTIENSTWHPQFGKSLANKQLKVIFSSHQVCTIFSLVESTG